MSPDASTVIDAYMAGLEGESRRVAPGEWGLTVDAAGWPLHVGVAIRDGLVRAQGEVLAAGQLPPEALLRWNRGLPFVRFAHTGAGDVWIEGDLPLDAVSAEQLDRFLGLLVRVATEAREAAR
ncbi:MAG: YbjN domain-containing protein [Actinomycetota bacterium]|nr:YbjN domain-containing protein [Actinomycetota bacterium]MDQ6915813.1 YbjN domain-containing protein [Actinomycetota bacterium]